jgi:pyridoxamine 5'-phosphate oxidase
MPLATADKDQPHVRGMLMYRADEAGILFHTGDFKSLWHQLQDNPKVEICFNDLKKGVQVRIMGKAQAVEDQGLKEEIVAARPFLGPWVEERGYAMFKVFRVTECRAAVWTMQTNFEATKLVIL